MNEKALCTARELAIGYGRAPLLSGIALDIASQVIEREVNEKDHEALIDEFIKNVGEAS